MRYFGNTNNHYRLLLSFGGRWSCSVAVFLKRNATFSLIISHKHICTVNTTTRIKKTADQPQQRRAACGDVEQLIMIVMPSRPAAVLSSSPCSFFLKGEQLKSVLHKPERQEDDSGVNHLRKGEMWRAQVGLIRARHVRNTRGAGANN